jgi:hypothetical protein
MGGEEERMEWVEEGEGGEEGIVSVLCGKRVGKEGIE